MKTTFLRMAVLCLVMVVMLGGTASWVMAHSGATGVTKERMDLMKDIADVMKVMGAMFKGEAPFESAVVVEKASFLADHAKTIPDMTPEGSNNHPSEALPIIWQEWDDYVQSAKELATESAKLVAIANDGFDESEVRAQYVKLGKTCGTCHDRFRKPKE